MPAASHCTSLAYFVSPTHPPLPHTHDTYSICTAGIIDRSPRPTTLERSATKPISTESPIMRAEKQPLLDKESSAASASSSGSGGPSDQRRSTGAEAQEEGALSLDMSGRAGVDIRYPPGVGPGSQQAGRGGLHDHPPAASYQVRWMDEWTEGRMEGGSRTHALG